MGKVIDITGQRFGRLVARTQDGYLGTSVAWLCDCDCGEVARVASFLIRNGKTKSCGCLQRELLSKRVTTHGQRAGGRSSRAYKSYYSMRARCLDTSHIAYDRYGGRGITICNRWLNGEGGQSGFECFYADMGDRPEGFSIEREDTNGNYEPDNCRWANRCAQMQNRRDNIITSERVEQMRSLAATGKYKRGDLADLFGIKPEYAGAIIAHRKWGEAA